MTLMVEISYFNLLALNLKKNIVPINIIPEIWKGFNIHVASFLPIGSQNVF